MRKAATESDTSSRPWLAGTALDRSYVQVHDSTGRLLSRISHAAWVAKPGTSADKAAMVEPLRAIGGDASFADSPRMRRRRTWA